MKIPDLLPPERVREIAQMVTASSHSCYIERDEAVAFDAINAAAPEFARAALEWAAKQCRECGVEDVAQLLEQEEIET